MYECVCICMYIVYIWFASVHSPQNFLYSYVIVWSYKTYCLLEIKNLNLNYRNYPCELICQIRYWADLTLDHVTLKRNHLGQTTVPCSVITCPPKIFSMMCRWFSVQDYQSVLTLDLTTWKSEKIINSLLV